MKAIKPMSPALAALYARVFSQPHVKRSVARAFARSKKSEVKPA